MDSFVKNLPLIYCPLPLPLLLLAEVESVGGGEGRRQRGYWGATVGKVKISIRLSVTAVSHRRKTGTEAGTPLPGVFQHDTYSSHADLFLSCSIIKKAPANQCCEKKH